MYGKNGDGKITPEDFYKKLVEIESKLDELGKKLEEKNDVEKIIIE
jgi:hypothetical protein